MFLLCAGTARAQSNSSQDELPPVLRCGKARLVSTDGQPLAKRQVGLMWMEVDWSKGPGQSVNIAVKNRKNLKTDANGEISVPKVADGRYGPYLLEVLLLDAATQEMTAEGHFQSAAKPESCSQALEVRNKQIVLKPEGAKAK
jgi:hypothetical protein